MSLNPTAPIVLRKSEYDDILSDILDRQVKLTYLVFVETLADLPTPISNVITLLQDTCYFFANSIDLTGNRFVCEPNVIFLAASSENCTITSTGLLLPLITSNYTIVVRHITFTVDTVLDIDGLGTAALDWTGVNFRNCNNVGTIKNFTNFIFDKGALLNSSNLIFDGTSDTIAITNSLIQSVTDGILVYPTAVISRRFRITYSSISVPALYTGVKVDNLATIPTESFILDTVNFSGAGTYVTGVTVTSNKSLFVNCKGIPNTSVNGQVYMQANATPTIIPNTTDFFKVAGITIPSPDNSKYLHSNNRLTNDAVIERRFLVLATVTFHSGNNDECEFAIYDSTIAGVRTDSITATTANGAGRAENIKVMSLISHLQGDYVEIWCRNTSAANNITVESLNLIIIES